MAATTHGRQAGRRAGSGAAAYLTAHPTAPGRRAQPCVFLGALLLDAVRGHALMDALLLGSAHRLQLRAALEGSPASGRQP